MIGYFTTLKSGTIDKISQSGTVDYATDSAAVSAFAVEVRQQTFIDPVLSAAWTRVADNGDVAAQVLVNGDQATSVDSLTTLLTAYTAAAKACTDYLQTPPTS